MDDAKPCPWICGERPICQHAAAAASLRRNAKSAIIVSFDRRNRSTGSSMTRSHALIGGRMVASRPCTPRSTETLSTRAPAGKETAWAYTHTPQEVRGDAGGDGLTGKWDERETETFVRRMEDQVEALAPGFRDLIRARHVWTPVNMEQADQNLVGGAVNDSGVAVPALALAVAVPLALAATVFALQARDDAPASDDTPAPARAVVPAPGLLRPAEG